MQRRGRHVEMIAIFIGFKQLLWMVLVFLTGTIYSVQNRLNQQMIRHKQLMEEKLQTELQLLKAQINPHFLFNALNNIYSLTYMQSEKAPESVLKLSEMLRYVIEDCGNEKVPLKNETAYIQSFIDFYKMKNPGERDIVFTYEIENQEIRIAPMLFIPFIENSFKYSRIEEDTKGYIHIHLIEKEGNLTFAVKNTLFTDRTILPGSGKGIANVKQRLEIIYPNQYKLNIDHKRNEFSVVLNINLS
jgi:LytS/YehU family sensor histidine kinase